LEEREISLFSEYVSFEEFNTGWDIDNFNQFVNDRHSNSEKINT
jgi:hypothetical protein